MSGMGNEVQARVIAEQVADAAAERAFMRMQTLIQPPAPKAEIPAPLKWAGGIAAAVMTLTATGGLAWGVSSLSDLRVTVARIDERQQQDTTGTRVTKLETKVEKVEERVGRIEAGKGGH